MPSNFSRFSRFSSPSGNPVLPTQILLVPTTIFLRLMTVNYTHYNDNWVGKWVTSSKTSSQSLATTLSSSDKWNARHKLSTSKNCLLGKRRLKVKEYEVKCNVSHSQCWYLPSVDIKTSEKWIQIFYKLRTIAIFFSSQKHICTPPIMYRRSICFRKYLMIYTIMTIMIIKTAKRRQYLTPISATNNLPGTGYFNQYMHYVLQCAQLSYHM